MIAWFAQGIILSGYFGLIRVYYMGYFFETAILVSQRRGAALLMQALSLGAQL